MTLRSGSPRQANQVSTSEQKKREKYQSQLHAYEVQLLDTEYLTKCVGFVNLVMAWLVRMVDPKAQHPSTQISLVISSSNY